MREGRALGYGVHAAGRDVWDGTTDAFVQFVNDGSVPGLTRQRWGSFEDVGAFYASVDKAHNKMSWWMRPIMGLLLKGPNAKVQAMRLGA